MDNVKRFIARIIVEEPEMRGHFQTVEIERKTLNYLIDRDGAERIMNRRRISTVNRKRLLQALDPDGRAVRFSNPRQAVKVVEVKEENKDCRIKIKVEGWPEVSITLPAAMKSAGK